MTNGNSGAKMIRSMELRVGQAVNSTAKIAGRTRSSIVWAMTGATLSPHGYALLATDLQLCLRSAAVLAGSHACWLLTLSRSSQPMSLQTCWSTREHEGLIQKSRGSCRMEIAFQQMPSQ